MVLAHLRNPTLEQLLTYHSVLVSLVGPIA